MADPLPCPGAALALASLAGLIARSGVASALVRRRAPAGKYLAPGGLVNRLLTGRVLVLGRQGIKGLTLGPLLLLGALECEPIHWGSLAADVALFGLLAVLLGRVLAAQVRADYRSALVRQWALRLTALLLWLAWLTLMVYPPQSNYLGLHWEEVLVFGASFAVALACRRAAAGVLARSEALGRAAARGRA